MVAKNHRPNHERYTKWSIRRLSVGVASVVVTSGFFILISNPVNAQVGSQNKVVTTTPSNSSTDLQKPIVDANTKQTEKATAGKQATPDTTKPSQELAGKTNQAPDKKVQEKQEVTKENKVGKTIAEAAKEIQKATEKVVKEATSKEEKDSSLDQAKKSVLDNIKSDINVPASYLDNATYPGPFTAGVNQVIPYELFGGDGMLTRLLLKSSNGAPWSDNGKANHPGLLPLAGLGKGQYFYQVSLDGNAAGKQDKELLEQLKANGTHSYKATVTVYGAKDGKADLSNVIATKSVTINLKGEKRNDPSGQKQEGQNNQTPSQGKAADHNGNKHSAKGATPSATSSKGGQAKTSKKSLPNTGQKSSLGLTVLGLLGLSTAAILALVGMKRREKK